MGLSGGDDLIDLFDDEEGRCVDDERRFRADTEGGGERTAKTDKSEVMEN